MTPSSSYDGPQVSGTVPTFLGARPVRDFARITGLDAVVVGVPWEGSNTWGSPSGCEQTPKACRLASMRYGTGYIPEYAVDVMSELVLGDTGDLPVHPTDVQRTFQSFRTAAHQLFTADVVPVFLGGDHSVTYPLLTSLTQHRPNRVGILHFDAHFDNSDEYGGDRLARCCPFRRIAELPEVDPSKIVHLGIRGPRNSASQMQYAREKGMTVFTMADIRREGLDSVVSEARRLVVTDTDGYYVTVCSDIIDHAYNPGGPLDFGGLSSGEMLQTLFNLAQGPILGLDIVEVYPLSDVNEASVHLVVWLVIYALAGLAVGLQSRSGGGFSTALR